MISRFEVYAGGVETRRSILLTCVLAGCGTTTERTRSRQPDVQLRGIEMQLFRAVNAERARRGLSPLIWHEEAAGVARRHSAAMAERLFFSHEDPKHGDPGQRLAAAGVKWQAVGENIYMQQGYSDPVRRAVEGWLESPGHRKNLLGKRYTHTGLGVAETRSGTMYFTQVFLVLVH